MSSRIISEISTMLLALGMAFLVWFAAVREEDPLITKNFQPNISLKAIPPIEELVVLNQEAIPEEIQVKIRAPQSVWQTLTLGRVKASLDLSSYSAGTHTVPVHVEILDAQATVLEIVPSDIVIHIEPLATKKMPVVIQVLDDPPLGYFNRLPISDPVSVVAKGSSAAVSLVDQVVGKIRINNSKETIEQEIQLSPLNNKGGIVPNILLEPASSQVAVPIEQRFGYKEVSVKAKLVGQPTFGYWISSISVDPATVTLVGGPAVLQGVSGFIETFDVDISDAIEDVIKRAPLSLPPGSSVVVDEDQTSDTDRSVLVTVGISALTGGRTMQIDVTAQGASQALSWTVAPDTVEVILSGPLPVLSQLNKDDITVIVDLFDLPPGTHRLPLEVISPDEVEVASLIPDAVEIILTPILDEGALIPTPIPMETPSTAPTPSPTITPTDVSTASGIITVTNTVLSGTLMLPLNTPTLTSSIELTPSLN